MPEIIKVYKQKIETTRFIGKRYTNKDRIDGHFGAKWGEWHRNGWFNKVSELFDGNLSDVFEDGGSFIGLMHEENGFDSFEYWIGIFMPKDTVVPEGFSYIDFEASTLGVCWIYGNETEVYMLEGECCKRLEKEGFNVDTSWCFERYACPRFTNQDEKGNIILDICFFLND